MRRNTGNGKNSREGRWGNVRQGIDKEAGSGYYFEIRNVRRDIPGEKPRKGTANRRMTGLPEAFCSRMKGLLGEEYEAFIESYSQEQAKGLRLNRLKQVKEGESWEAWARDLAAETGFSLEQIPWAADGFYYQGSGRPGKHPYHEAGVYYIQEPSAMAVVELLDPQPGERILDLCAAPGGKTSHIASRLGGEGLLVSNEPHPARAKILSQNVERMGMSGCVVVSHEPWELEERFAGFFDRIVVDAPCSGEGMFRKDEQAAQQWSPEHVAMCARRQQEILDSAARMLKGGGRLVYSTCTFAPEENEGTIQCFLENHPQFQVEETAGRPGLSAGCPQWLELEKDPMDLKATFRIFPHRAKGEGHYIAVLRKENVWEDEEKAQPGEYLDLKKQRGLLGDYWQFLRENLETPDKFLGRKEYVMFGSQLYLAPPEMPSMKGLKVLRPGLHMGTLKKNRFEPSHALALYLRQGEAKRSISLKPEGDLAARYLRGEALGSDGNQWTELSGQKGWVLVCAGPYSLGWAKLAGGVLKNHYPKGLRWMQ